MKARFLEDSDGKVGKVLMTCLKPKVGLGTIVEDTPKHLPPDEDMFDSWDVIYGPLQAIPHGSDKFDVPDYEKVKELFTIVKIFDRKELLEDL